MSDDVTVKVKSTSGFTVQVQEVDLFNASTDSYNIPQIPTLGSIGDVDTSVLEHGSVLVYKTTQNKWQSTTLLDLQTMEGGEY